MWLKDPLIPSQITNQLMSPDSNSPAYLRCKKRFLRFLFRACFFTFFNVFILPTFFIFKNVHSKYHLKSLSKERKQIGSV